MALQNLTDVIACRWNPSGFAHNAPSHPAQSLQGAKRKPISIKKQTTIIQLSLHQINLLLSLAFEKGLLTNGCGSQLTLKDAGTKDWD